MAHDRRTLLRHLAASALLLPLLSAQPARALVRGGAFVAPDGPMLYSRRLERELPGGASLTVERSFAVRFVREGAGYRVEGEQVGVSVAAPEALASLADLERERVETGLFPLHLDASGQIDGGAEPRPSEQLDQAVREVLARISAAANRDEAEQADLQQFAVAVHQNASALLTHLPRDLFAPAEPQHEETRMVELPGGGEGLVRVIYLADADAATGLMRKASREVVTQLAASRRSTLESWTLTPRA